MTKPIFLTGIVLTALGAGMFGRFVLPHILSGNFGRQAGHVTEQTAGASNPLLTLAVLFTALALAAGFALIGIGAGHWKRPTPSPTDGTPEV